MRGFSTPRTSPPRFVSTCPSIALRVFRLDHRAKFGLRENVDVGLREPVGTVPHVRGEFECHPIAIGGAKQCMAATAALAAHSGAHRTEID